MNKARRARQRANKESFATRQLSWAFALMDVYDALCAAENREPDDEEWRRLNRAVIEGKFAQPGYRWER